VHFNDRLSHANGFVVLGHYYLWVGGAWYDDISMKYLMYNSLDRDRARRAGTACERVGCRK
jgi:hypothetical protein